MSIDFVAWGEAIGGLSLGGSGKAEGITARSFQYSEPVNYSGPRLLRLHQSGSRAVGPETPPMSEEDREHESQPLLVEEPAEQGSKLPPLRKRLVKLREEDSSLVALISLPANTKRVTVLLVPAEQETLVGYVINDDPRKLPPGRLRVHNLSPHTIEMAFGGGVRKVMEPRDSSVVKARNGAVIYQLSYRKDDKWQVQENNIIPVMPKHQTQLVVLKSRNRFFLSTDGATGGYLQMVTLRRKVE